MDGLGIERRPFTIGRSSDDDTRAPNSGRCPRLLESSHDSDRENRHIEPTIGQVSQSVEGIRIVGTNRVSRPKLERELQAPLGWR